MTSGVQDEDTVARELLRAARTLVNRSGTDTRGLWPRASALLARQAHQSWTALSRASHDHAYELPPTREELLAWFEGVQGVVEQTERAWRART